MTEMGKTVKVGVLGYGFVQETFHLPCYLEIPGADVVAIGGRSKERATHVAKKFGVKKSTTVRTSSRGYVQIVTWK